MPVRTLEDRDAIEAFLRRDPMLHLYELGDLDDFFWPNTRWFGLVTEGDPHAVHAVALLYTATDLPVLVLMGREDDSSAPRALLRALRPSLPARFYAHLVPGIVDVLGDSARLEGHGRHDRMILVDRAAVDAVDTAEARPLSPSDVDEVTALLRRAYPENWFDPRMLETGAYFGIRRVRPTARGSIHDDAWTLVSAAGVHVVSHRYRIAALGNIATDPAARGLRLARTATAAVCKALGETYLIGLNVESTNTAAIATYRALGFERIASYDEVLVIQDRLPA